MTNFEKIHSPETKACDITTEFMSAVNTGNFSDFRSFLRTVTTSPLLEIHADFTSLDDKYKFISYSRKLKAFLEEPKPDGQERNASIRCTTTQKAWEPNVFSSGVVFENSDP